MTQATAKKHPAAEPARKRKAASKTKGAPWHPWHTTLHPMAKVFPGMSAAHIEVLHKDIMEHGQKVPIVVLPDGQLIDGRHRDTCLVALGIKPKTVVYKGPTDDASILRHIISLNLARRHLTTRNGRRWRRR